MNEDKCYEICKEMLEARGYEIMEETEDQIIAVIDDETLCVFFTDIPKFNANKLQQLIAIMNGNDVTHSIIVFKNEITAPTRKIIDNISDMRIEIFSSQELQFNITKHKFQPHFSKLPRNEAIRFKKAYGLKFPHMLKTDAIARFYGYQKGDVIEVERNGEVTYRIVRD